MQLCFLQQRKLTIDTKRIVGVMFAFIKVMTAIIVAIKLSMEYAKLRMVMRLGKVRYSARPSV